MSNANILPQTEKRLDEIAEQHRQKVANDGAALREAMKKRAQYNDLLEGAEDAEEYQRIIRDRKDNDDLIAFLQNKNRTFKPIIDEFYYKSVLEDARDRIDQLQDEYAPKLMKKLNELISMMDEYTEQAHAAERVIDKASKLFYNGTGSRHYTGDIASKCDDPYLWFDHFSRMYFNHAAGISRVRAGVNKGTKMFMSSSENIIAKAIRSQKK